MSEEPEPLSAILAEMRGMRTDMTARGECGVSFDRIESLASRIEAAAERERETAEAQIRNAWTEGYCADPDKAQPGNAAAMREALKRILAIEGYGAPWIEAKCIAQKALEGGQYTPPLAQERPKIEQPGNAATLRDALEKCRDYFYDLLQGEYLKAQEAQQTGYPSMKQFSNENRLLENASAALAAPARNCDRAKDAAEDLFKERFWRPWTQAEDDLAAWLFAPAKENGGNKQ